MFLSSHELCSLSFATLILGHEDSCCFTNKLSQYSLMEFLLAFTICVLLEMAGALQLAFHGRIKACGSCVKSISVICMNVSATSLSASLKVFSHFCNFILETERISVDEVALIGFSARQSLGILGFQLVFLTVAFSAFLSRCCPYFYFPLH